MKSDELQISMLTGSMTRWLALLLLLSSCDARLLLAAEKPKSTTGSTSSYITDLGRRLLRRAGESLSGTPFAPDATAVPPSPPPPPRRASARRSLGAELERDRQPKRRDGELDRWWLEQRSARVIVVANRLPLQIKRNASVAGGWEYSVSSGGMVSALLGVRGVRMVWVGWCAVDDATPAEQARLRRTLWKTQGILPIFVDKRTAELHYNGFCNDVLWPNFHYVVARTPGEETAAGATEQEAWAAYRAVNEQFAEAVRSILRPGDTVWVHDYHLMLLPSLLRKPGYDAPARLKVGWFLHTPWPSPEVFRTLPMRRQLLEGLLGADVLGFHVYDYARYFLQACTQLLGDEVALSARKLTWTPAAAANADAEHADAANAAAPSHSLVVDAYPIGIDPPKFERALASAAVRGRVAQLRSQFAGQRVLLGIDRVDYIKGVRAPPPPPRALACHPCTSSLPHTPPSLFPYRSPTRSSHSSSCSSNTPSTSARSSSSRSPSPRAPRSPSTSARARRRTASSRPSTAGLGRRRTCRSTIWIRASTLTRWSRCTLGTRLGRGRRRTRTRRGSCRRAAK